MSLPDIDESDIAAVEAALRSDRLALGPASDEFERAVADYVGVQHAITVNSGTSALHLMVRALDLTPGDEVLVPSFTFAASVNVLLYERLTPVFVDIEPETYNLDPEDLEARISPRTRAIMAVDVFGHPAEWDAILDIAARHHLRVLDDSCEALGASYKGRRLGQFGEAAAFAFYPNKQITTGEGGIIVTDSDDIARLCLSMRNQGRGEMGAWLEHARLGYNYRMDEMSAALGASQMRRLETFLAKRARVAQGYTEQLRGLPWLRPPVVRPHVEMSWFVYVITLREGLSRDAVIAALEARGIPARGYFAPIHAQSYMRPYVSYDEGMLPVTESIARRTLALPFHNNLAEQDILRVVEALTEIGRQQGWDGSGAGE
ncbi:MAG: DegT/DnrJ/EryC1/StrS family aminotransferase [Anaerolineae bacterium]|nr:DegT/DnrJ/EryC1/StrS family aminotransferase [Anaerolineae bacterium]